MIGAGPGRDSGAGSGREYGGIEILTGHRESPGKIRRLEAEGVNVQIVVIHERRCPRAERSRWEADRALAEVITIAEGLQDTSVDAIVAGHTHRISNLQVGKITVVEGINAGATYSVLQIMVTGKEEVHWIGSATRVAYSLGVTPNAQVQAIVDAANAETAVLRNQVIGTQAEDILRDPARLSESAMGDMVADAMRAKYPNVEGGADQFRRPAGRPGLLTAQRRGGQL